MTTVPQSPQLGSVIGGRYRVDALLGTGGFGMVYLATQLDFDRQVALKVLLPQGLTEEGLGRFHREARVFQKLEHPNVVRLFDFWQGGSESLPFLVFELLRGKTLEEILRTKGGMPPARVVRVTSQILKALMEAHSRGIIHRDVKPANVFLCDFQGEPDFVKLIDFGLAKGGGYRTLTHQGAMIGTVPYMAPEQIDGRDASFASDLFALGLTISEMISGKPVLSRKDVNLVARALAGPEPIPHTAEALSSPLGPIIHRATRKRPEQRYPSAAEMLAHLDAVVSYGMGAAPTAPRRASDPATPVPNASPIPAPSPPAAPALQLPPTNAPAIEVSAIPVAPTDPIPEVPTAPPAPRVPPAPPRRKPSQPAGPVGIVLGTLALLALGSAGAILVLWATGGLHRGAGSRTSSARPSASTPPPPTPAPSGSAAAPSLVWIGLRSELQLAELDVNGDGVVDFAAFCTDEGRRKLSLCAVDGATFQTLWRRPLPYDLGAELLLTAVGPSFAYVDPAGVLRVREAATGADQGAVTLGSRAERLCAPAEIPGKLWVRLRERSPVLYDPGTRSVVDTPRPLSCGRSASEQRCHMRVDPESCPPEPGEPRPPEASVVSTWAEGPNGVALGSKRTDNTIPMIIGFTPDGGGPGPRNRARDGEIRVRWVRPLAPGDGLGAVHGVYTLALQSGRAVTHYDHTSGGARVIAVDAARGGTLWEVPSGPVSALWLTATRVYVQRHEGLDVRDATSGRLLGTVGKPEG